MFFALVPFIVLYFLVKLLFFQPKKPAGHGELKKRIGDILNNQEGIKYDLRVFDMPKITGRKFKLLMWLSYTPIGKYVIAPLLMRRSNLHRMGAVQMHENPTYYPKPLTPPSPVDHTLANQKILQELLDQDVQGDSKEFHLPTVADYVHAYRSGKTTPTEVAKAVLNAIADSDKANPPLRAVTQSNRSVVLDMASAASLRWKEGNTLSIIDGVPVAVKEEFRCDPYIFRAGASYVPLISEGIPESAIVEKLKEAGAVIIGVTNMQEFGTGTLGSNPHPPQLTARNPYNPECYPGGSSSGSAVSVAAGFCPIAIGADGGGSIRIPAAVCGVVGLKPTFGVVNSLGILAKAFTVGSSGPLTSSVLDTAIAMDIISQEGNKRPVSLEGLGETRLDGLKVGVYWEHFNHADKELTLKCKAALSQLENLGAVLVDIKIPEMEDSRVAHVISIGAEFSSSLSSEINHHYSELNLETHLLVGMSYGFSATEYVNSQKQRTRAMEALEYIFQRVDVIVTPGSGLPAPPIDPEAIPLGVLDGTTTAEMMRFSFLANLTGIPGLVLPVGYTKSGLPVSLQLMGSWYQESVLLKVGRALEKSGAFPAKKPKVFYDVIGSD